MGVQMDFSKPPKVSQRPWWLGLGGSLRTSHISNDGVGYNNEASSPALSLLSRVNARLYWEYLRAEGMAD